MGKSTNNYSHTYFQQLKKALDFHPPRELRRLEAYYAQKQLKFLVSSSSLLSSSLANQGPRWPTRVRAGRPAERSSSWSNPSHHHHRHDHRHRHKTVTITKLSPSPSVRHRRWPRRVRHRRWPRRVRHRRWPRPSSSVATSVIVSGHVRHRQWPRPSRLVVS